MPPSETNNSDKTVVGETPKPPPLVETDHDETAKLDQATTTHEDADEMIVMETSVPPPLLSDNVPYVEEHGDNVVIKLDLMDVETRINLERVLNMYALPETHYDRIISPIQLVADLLRLNFFQVAFCLDADDLAAWDWRQDLPTADKVPTDQVRIMHKHYQVIDQERPEEAKKLKGRIKGLKSWRHYLRLWRQGRQLYSNWQHIFRNKTNTWVQAKIEETFSDCVTKNDIQESMRKLLASFLVEKKAEERQQEMASRSKEGNFVMGTQVDATVNPETAVGQGDDSHSNNDDEDDDNTKTAPSPFGRRRRSSRKRKTLPTAGPKTTGLDDEDEFDDEEDETSTPVKDKTSQKKRCGAPS
ncbi:hypothetical protein SEMRO_1085_G239550.1 [Seminavis robusta]|uniref:Uncharacterized protein n=1 Tax=Seminavis robusta TaxID=568900 RepID=A0A9N8EK08_9STRA|nr:hypothetical protein SEMRO_1085_G239550.1 [Seminavis robusta]|eukprot:Sro1085_g239550.1 n/a (358) ;mRNA; r:3633-4706